MADPSTGGTREPPVDSGQPSASRARRITGAVLRIGFAAAVACFAILTFWDDWPAVVRAIGERPWWATVGAIALMATGVLLSLPTWNRLLQALGVDIPAARSATVLLIGQLGKYLPGSVWTVAVQAQLLRVHRVSVRRAITASLLYIAVYLAMAVFLGAIAIGVSGGAWGIPSWLLVGIGIVAVLGLTPPVLNRVGRLVAGRSASVSLTWSASGAIVVTMTASWMCWVGAPVLLAGAPADAGLVIAIASATLVGYAAGLLVVIAPAGFGVREAVVVAMVAPYLGTVAALAIALLTRVAGLIADLLLAGIAWFASRRSIAPESIDSGASDRA